MGEIKSLGSEKLDGMDKLKRILEITYYDNEIVSEEKKAEFISKSNNGVYGIIKEKDGYYVKKGLNEDKLDYIGGLYMKNKNKFPSYAEALKRLNLLESQDLQEAVKYVLKQKPSNTDVPVPETEAVPPTDTIPPTTDGEATIPNTNNTELPPDTTEPSPEDNTDDNENNIDDVDSEENYIKSIQKLTGKLGQKLRDFEDKIESDDIKYVINSVLSAVDLNKLEDEDREEILSNIDGDDETDDSDTADYETTDSETDIPTDNNNETEPDDVDEIVDDLDEFISTPIDVSEYEEYPYDEHDERDDIFDTNDDYEETSNDDDLSYDDKNRSYLGAMKNSYDFSQYEKDFDPEAISDDEIENEYDFDDNQDEDIEENDYLTVDDLTKTNQDIEETDDFNDFENNQDDYSPKKCKYCGRTNGHYKDCPNNKDSSRQIDIDELTNRISSSIKNSLGEYFK